MALLPPEIVQEIVEMSLLSSRSPMALLTSCSAFRDIVQQILYAGITFTSRAQLRSFTMTYCRTPVPYAPRAIAVHITNDDFSNIVFSDFSTLVSTCFWSASYGPKVSRDQNGRLVLDLLLLRLYSHMYDPGIERIYSALSQINPRRFIWTGPDPPHHFSIAIVPNAIPHLFKALSTYTNLTELRLANIKVDDALEEEGFPVIPSLELLYMGQVVFLPSVTIANLILDPGMEQLERVNLVDAYTGSIWGPRLRRSDVVRAALLHLDPENSDPRKSEMAKETIESILVCEARTERIMGDLLPLLWISKFSDTTHSSRNSSTSDNREALLHFLCLSVANESTPSEPPCPDPLRSPVRILWTCIGIIIACTWVALHPNITSKPKPWIRERLGADTGPLPSNGRLHAHPPRSYTNLPLTPPSFERLSSQDTIEWPSTPLQEIEDKSKGSGLAKALVLSRTTFFIGKCLMRMAQGKRVAELELLTLAFACLNGDVLALVG
ncbi:unnamed protein product [Cyclocybe aegerita]|uniref:Uncharacterized protein n=1 Tax=Cyclocybe aegerita TaxID=1973307 RepID=A0A8S0W1A2_CYCAE|nr:unnamed protein product [Cyclocybe aegerita]